MTGKGIGLMLRQIWAVYNAPYTAQQKRNYLRYLRRRPGIQADYGPVRLSLVSTGACNLRCVMCHSHSPQVPEDYAFRQERVGAISLDLFKHVVDRYDTPLSVDIIGGGEPLLNPDLFKIIEYGAHQKHMVMKTFSNGLVLHKFIDRILDSPLSGLTVSLNGHDGAEFDRLTEQGAPTFETIVRNLRALVSARNARRSPMLVKVSFILDQQNWRHLPAMLDLARDIGVDKVFLCNFLHTPFAGARAEERSLFVDHAEAVAFIAATLAALPDHVRRSVDPPLILERQITEKRCRVHDEQLRVDAEGNVNSCSTMLLKMTGHGHVLDEGLWNNRFFTGMRRMFLEPQSPLPEPCRVCPNNVGISVDAATRATQRAPETIPLPT